MLIMTASRSNSCGRSVIAGVACALLFSNLVPDAFAQVITKDPNYGRPDLKEDFRLLRNRFGVNWGAMRHVFSEHVGWNDPDAYDLWEYIVDRPLGECYRKFKLLSAYGRVDYGYNPWTHLPGSYAGPEQFAILAGPDGTVINQRRSSINLEVVVFVLPEKLLKLPEVLDWCNARIRQISSPMFKDKQRFPAGAGTWDGPPSTGGYFMHATEFLVRPRSSGSPWD